MDENLSQRQQELIQWLLEIWLLKGPNVCFVEGFSGVGKTQIARSLLGLIGHTGREPVMVNMPEMGANPVDDVLLDLATELSEKGYKDLEAAVDEGRDLLQAFERVLQQPVVVVIDEFQNAFHGKTARPLPALFRLLDRLGRRVQQGRLLLLCNRSVERAQWSEAHEIRLLQGLLPIEGEALLATLLEKYNLHDEVTESRRIDVVRALGGNPRAIHVLVQCLRWESLDELIGSNPELWEFRDREISPELLSRLEIALLERTLEHLTSDTISFLEGVIVHRKPVKQEAFKHIAQNQKNSSQLRNELIDRFLHCTGKNLT